MSVKLVVGILLFVAVLLAGPAQAPKVVIVYDKDAGTAQSGDDTKVQDIPVFDNMDNMAIGDDTNVQEQARTAVPVSIDALQDAINSAAGRYIIID